MDEKILKNYRRFKKYTLKLAVVCLAVGLICLLLFRNHPYISVMFFVASISAFGHHAFLKIMLFHYDKEGEKEDG